MTVTTMHAPARTYRVVVTREDGMWLADVPQLEGASTFSRTLSGLDRSVREVVVLAADLPDEAMAELELELEFHTGDADLDVTSHEVRTLRQQSKKAAAHASSRTTAAAIQLIDHGYSIRDTAIALGLSPQRVSQLAATTHR